MCTVDLSTLLCMQAWDLLVLRTYFGMYHVCVTWQVDSSLDIGQCLPTVIPITSLCAAHYRSSHYHLIVVLAKRCFETQSLVLLAGYWQMHDQQSHDQSQTVRPSDRSYQDQPTLQIKRMQPYWLSNPHLLRIIHGIQYRNLNVDQLNNIGILSRLFSNLETFCSTLCSHAPSKFGTTLEGIEFQSSMGRKETESRLGQDRHRARGRTVDKTKNGEWHFFFFLFLWLLWHHSQKSIIGKESNSVEVWLVKHDIAIT